MIPSKKIECLGIFERCAPQEIKTIARNMEDIYYQKNRSIYQQGDPSKSSFIISEGIVELNWYDEEHDKIFHICLLQQGDIFGVGEMFFDTYYINAIAVTKCSLLSIKKAVFFEYFMNAPSLKEYVLMTFAHVVRQQTTMKGWHSARRLFNQFIFFLCRDHGTFLADTIIISKCVKHEHIASILNLSREHVTRLFRQFKKDGTILKSGKETIVDLAWYERKKEDPAYQISFRRNFNTIVEFF